MNEDEI